MLDKPTLRTSVELAIATEQLGRENYTRLADGLTGRPEVARILRQLAADERDHELQFRSLLLSLPPDDVPAEDDDRYVYLRATASREFFSEELGTFGKPEHIASPGVALRRAIRFEKATVAYYYAIQDILGKNPVLDKIIAEEKRHVVSLMRVILTDAEFRGLAENYL